jgi:beta-lactamase class A
MKSNVSHRRTGLLAGLLLVASALAQTPLDHRVHHALHGFQGNVALYAKNLDTGASYGLHPDQKVRTASTIKLAMMAAVFDAVAHGQAKWSDELVTDSEDRVSGSGVLAEFSDGVHIPIRDVMHLMIVVSDNTATNLLISRFGADAANREMDKLGLANTRLMRKVMSDGNGPASGVSAAGRLPENKKYGLGSSTPREMVTLLEKMAKGEVVSPAASKEMLAVMKRQQDRAGIARKLGQYEIANKSGALDHLRSDVGIVYTPGGRIAMAITCDDIPKIDWSPDNPGLLMIAKLAKILVVGLE